MGGVRWVDGYRVGSQLRVPCTMAASKEVAHARCLRLLCLCTVLLMLTVVVVVVVASLRLRSRCAKNNYRLPQIHTHIHSYTNIYTNARARARFCKT